MDTRNLRPRNNKYIGKKQKLQVFLYTGNSSKNPNLKKRNLNLKFRKREIGDEKIRSETLTNLMERNQQLRKRERENESNNSAQREKVG